MECLGKNLGKLRRGRKHGKVVDTHADDILQGHGKSGELVDIGRAENLLLEASGDFFGIRRSGRRVIASQGDALGQVKHPARRVIESLLIDIAKHSPIAAFPHKVGLVDPMKLLEAARVVGQPLNEGIFRAHDLRFPALRVLGKNAILGQIEGLRLSIAMLENNFPHTIGIFVRHTAKFSSRNRIIFSDTWLVR